MRSTPSSPQSREEQANEPHRRSSRQASGLSPGRSRRWRLPPSSRSWASGWWTRSCRRSKNLHASPSQVELLFTSYFAFTGISMLVSSAVASRIGAKRTLLAGLVLIIAFSARRARRTPRAIVGLRAGWGLGNALFIATALSVIIGSASGGVAGAVVLYEAALGLGISIGPLLGGGARRHQLARPVLRRRGPDGDRVRRDQRVPGADPRRRERENLILVPLRALPHRAARAKRTHRALLQLRVLHAAGLHAASLHLEIHQLGYLHRLGAAAGDLRCLRRPPARPPLRRRSRPGRRARGDRWDPAADGRAARVTDRADPPASSSLRRVSRDPRTRL